MIILADVQTVLINTLGLALLSKAQVLAAFLLTVGIPQLRTAHKTVQMVTRTQSPTFANMQSAKEGSVHVHTLQRP